MARINTHRRNNSMGIYGVRSETAGAYFRRLGTYIVFLKKAFLDGGADKVGATVLYLFTRQLYKIYNCFALLFRHFERGHQLSGMPLLHASSSRKPQSLPDLIRRDVFQSPISCRAVVLVFCVRGSVFAIRRPACGLHTHSPLLAFPFRTVTSTCFGYLFHLCQRRNSTPLLALWILGDRFLRFCEDGWGRSYLQDWYTE